MIADTCTSLPQREISIQALWKNTLPRPRECMSVGHEVQSIWLLPQQQMASMGFELLP